MSHFHDETCPTFFNLLTPSPVQFKWLTEAHKPPCYDQRGGTDGTNWIGILIFAINKYLLFAADKDVTEIDKISVIHSVWNDSDWDGVLENDPPPTLYSHNRSLQENFGPKVKGKQTFMFAAYPLSGLTDGNFRKYLWKGKNIDSKIYSNAHRHDIGIMG